jgi:hypothetical protein
MPPSKRQAPKIAVLHHWKASQINPRRPWDRKERIYAYGVFFSVASDEQQSDSGDDEGRGEAELEVAEEGERVSVALGAACLLADDEIGGGAQEGEVAGHRAGPR